jgi:shikimate kinase
LTWKGAALGVNLKCDADVEVYDVVPKDDSSEKVSLRVLSNQTDEHSLVEHCVKQTFENFGVKGKGARVTVDSQIPVAKGLKSSSAVSNAVVLATLGALGKDGNVDHDPQDILNIAVDASLASRASLTGAYDDASACLLGGLVVTDNKARKIDKRVEIDEKLRVVIYVPPDNKFTSDVDVEALKPFASLSSLAYDLASHGNIHDALKLNVLAQSAAFGYSTEPVRTALLAGAEAAGLSGKGPAVAALCYEDRAERVADAWKDLDGFVVQCSVNNKRGGMLAWH